jgi:ribosomal subunit interface protein
VPGAPPNSVEVSVDIVVKGRNVEVPDHYRQLVAEKLGRVERYDHKLIRVDVELLHEPNPRQSASCQRVEITCKTRGPVIRAEACAENFYTALDTAIAKIEGRLRRSADRRRVHHGSRTPTSVANATSPALNGNGPLADTMTLGWSESTGGEVDDEPDDHLPGRVVREKEHAGEPISLDQAVFEMELVGHDFFLFADQHTGLPSVVYRRKGYDYGVIRLRT